jgi:hypothetical protein
LSFVEEDRHGMFLGTAMPIEHFSVSLVVRLHCGVFSYSSITLYWYFPQFQGLSLYGMLEGIVGDNLFGVGEEELRVR